MAPQLSHVQRMAIIAHRDAGHTIAEIGRRTGISVSLKLKFIYNIFLYTFELYVLNI